MRNTNFSILRGIIRDDARALCTLGTLSVYRFDEFKNKKLMTVEIPVVFHFYFLEVIGHQKIHTPRSTADNDRQTSRGESW